MSTVADDTLAWLREVVVGLNLCPFAAPVLNEDRFALVVSDAVTPIELLADISTATRQLLESDRTDTETSLIVFSHALAAFDDFLAFVPVAEAWLEEEGLAGTLQFATFHPHYQFDGVADSARENYTNRAPWPMLHLLREASVADAVDSHPDTSAIPTRNQAMLTGLSDARWRAIFGRSRTTQPAASRGRPAP
ncbi:MAG: DUF1415 domain-containing protein [Pseudomonadota bacterium]